MADSTPNYKVSQQQLRVNIMTLRTTIERQKLEILEMEDRTARNEENIAASLTAIADVEKSLADLEREHGS